MQVLVCSERVPLKVRKQLEEREIILLEVKDVSHVRWLSPTPSLVTADATLMAAMEAVCSDDGIYRNIMSKFCKTLYAGMKAKEDK